MPVWYMWRSSSAPKYNLAVSLSIVTLPAKVALPKLPKLYTTSLPLVSLVAISIYEVCALLSTAKSDWNLISPLDVIVADVDKLSIYTLAHLLALLPSQQKMQRKDRVSP